VEISSTEVCGALRGCIVEKFGLNVPQRKILLNKGITTLDPLRTLTDLNIQDLDKISFSILE
jgi:hypothetical protein